MKKKLALTLLLLTLCCTGCSGTSKEAKNVISKIQEMGEITLDSKDMLTGIQGEYDALSEEDKAAIENYADLEAAFETYNQLVYDSATNLMAEKKYEEAWGIFEEVADFSDAADQILECKYLRTQEYMDEMAFDEALALLEQIGDYKLSVEYKATCEYELSTDGKFMRALAAGLEKRWEYSDSFTETLSQQERANCIACESELLYSFDDEKFNDTSLGEKALAYIQALKDSEEALGYYSANTSKYLDLWDEAYYQRALLIRDFYDNYGLQIDPKYENTLKDFLNTAKAVEEQNVLEEELQKEIDKIECSKKTEYGWTTYTFTFTNTTDETFDHFYFEVQLIDEDDIIVETTYTDSVSDFAPGQKAKFEFSSEEKVNKMRFKAEF